jgi:hypothetical protein
MNVRLVSEIEHHGFVKLELFFFGAKYVIHVCRWRYIDFPIVGGERHGRDRIVVGFITTYAINAYHVVNNRKSKVKNK